MKTYNTIHEGYLGTLADVWNNYGHRCSPRGLPVREKLDYSFKILNPVAEPIVTNDLARNETIRDYTTKETTLYNSCSNRVEDFVKASKFWEKLAAPDGTITSAYGYLIWAKLSHGNLLFEGKMRTPWVWCVEALKMDKDTRQAILRFSLPEHFWVGNKDMTCTLSGNWLIRDNKLNFSVVMRSQDMVKGAAYDWPWFISLMDRMVEELKPTYPNLTKGVYTHIVHNIHCYEKDEVVINKMLGRS